ncbi:MAG: NUDIX domain-containing protein [bacterium]|nr:NUDIX domain-containing protein [bacterium]
MPHIHTQPGEIDLCVNVYVVYKNKVLLRFHDKHKMWLMPGGHIELDEVPEDAAVREIKEEVGLDVKLWKGNQVNFPNILPASERYRELTPPILMNIHKINDEHRHIDLVYFATATTDIITEPNTQEKSGGCRWLTKEELLADPVIEEHIKQYSVKALELLAT